MMMMRWKGTAVAVQGWSREGQAGGGGFRGGSRIVVVIIVVVVVVIVVVGIVIVEIATRRGRQLRL